MSLADNQLHPLQIEDARDAAFRASEKQRDVEDELRTKSRALAEAERAYRKKLTERILSLKSEGVAITMCGEIARGEKQVADLRYNRDVAQGVLEAIRQQAFRRGADRKDVEQLVQWSRARDLRTDTPPADWGQAETVGNGERRGARAVA